MFSWGGLVIKVNAGGKETTRVIIWTVVCAYCTRKVRQVVWVENFFLLGRVGAHVV